MPKHKNSDILTSIQDVSQLMQQDKTDAEIISILNIPQRTLTRYNSQFHLLGQGAGNDLRVYDTIHITVNSDGEITANVDNFKGGCG